MNNFLVIVLDNSIRIITLQKQWAGVPLTQFRRKPLKIKHLADFSPLTGAEICRFCHIDFLPREARRSSLKPITQPKRKQRIEPDNLGILIDFRLFRRDIRLHSRVRRHWLAIQSTRIACRSCEIQNSFRRSLIRCADIKSKCKMLPVARNHIPKSHQQCRSDFVTKSICPVPPTGSATSLI